MHDKKSYSDEKKSEKKKSSNYDFFHFLPRKIFARDDMIVYNGLILKNFFIIKCIKNVIADTDPNYLKFFRALLLLT